MSEYPVITAAAAGALVILQMALQFATSLLRGKHMQGLGDGGHKSLEIAIRRHGNLIENAPILLFVLFLLEIGGLGKSWIIGFALLTVTGRIAHAIGLTVSPDRPHPLRFFGAMSSVLIGLAGGAWLIAGIGFHV